MVPDEFPFGLGYGFFDRLQLLRDIHAIPSGGNHVDDTVQMPLGTPQPAGNVVMMSMNFLTVHVVNGILPRRLSQCLIAG